VVFLTGQGSEIQTLTFAEGDIRKCANDGAAMREEAASEEKTVA